MEADEVDHVGHDEIEDLDDNEHHEKRRRRDFVGTELERQKKSSRQRNKKRQRSESQPAQEEHEMAVSTTMEEDTLAHANEPISPADTAPAKKKKGPLGVRGATRAFNVIADNEMTPTEALALIGDMSKTVEETSDALAKYLWEPNKTALLKCLMYFDRSRIVAWLNETIEVEKGAGMGTMRGERRKTPGGVFFALINRDATQEDLRNTIGIPRVKTRAKVGIPKKFQAKYQHNLLDHQPDATGKESLEGAKMKRNPFALDPSVVASSSAGVGSSTFPTSFNFGDEDLGETV